MKFLESFSIAISSLVANKLRSSLTMLGIIIGVGAVITLMSIGRGAQASITSAYEQLGTNLLSVIPRSPEVQGFAGLMRSMVVSAEEGWRKPHPSLFQKAMRELGVAPAESIFVGDSPWHDIAGAHGAGMRAVLTRQYVARPYSDADPQPDAVIDHVRELPGVIIALDRTGS